MVDDSDRLPLTRSLEAEVRAAFAVPPRAEGLNQQALLSALEGLRNFDRPLTAALSDAGFMPPNADDQPVLDWVDAVFARWAQQYPLAPELQQALERARSLAAAFAIRDNRFFIPGGHALHRLLDVIHNGLTGWHAGLGAAAGNALEGAKEALERARRDFPSEPQVDETLELLSQKINAHSAQLQRLDSVLLERERAAMGEDIARLSTACALNNLLAAHEVPGSVARFIKSDWFESGILIASRQGTDSEPWQSFLDTTQLLIEAVQPVSSEDADGQQRLQVTMQQLPSTLSRQLLSLQPDHDAVAGAVGLIEYALLRNMRGEDLGLLQAEPIMERGMPEGGPPSEEELLAHGIERGGWFALDTAEGEVRIRLAGGLADNIYLLFMDFLGARAIRKPFTEFKSLLVSGEARPLNVPDSFCRAMVEATEARQQSRSAEMAAQAQAAAAAQAEAEREQAAFAEQLRGGGEQSSSRPQQDAGDYAHARPEPTPEANHSALARTHSDDSDAMPSAESPYESNTVVKLQIPMGTWMGFHDRDPPLMARVAVRDLDKDSYIFTNREGIKLRELTVAQLIALIDRDMVDILERKTNFRETVNQMRQDQERLANSMG